MVPTRRFWLLALLGVPLAVITTRLGSPWVVLVYDTAILLAAWVTTKLAPNLSGIRVERNHDPVLSVRVPNRVELKILNDGVETVQMRLRDEPPAGCVSDHYEFDLHLEPGREVVLPFHVTPWERGATYFRGSFARVVCPLGLAEKWERLRTEQPVRVYPNVLALREFDLLKQKGRLTQIGIRKSRVRGLGTEFESLREYAEGDDYRKIDWKATARKGKLVVRQFEAERNQAVVIAIDVGRKMLGEVNGVTKLDHALDACLMLANAAAGAGDFVGLLVYSDTVKRFLPPRKGRVQLGAIIEAMHDLIAEPVESDPERAFSYLATRWKRRSLLVTFTDLEDEIQSNAYCRAYGSLARRHLALTVRVADPNLKSAAATQVEDAESLYVRAASMRFLADRQRAGTELESFGMHGLESEPQDLAASLVSFYFLVKERSLL